MKKDTVKISLNVEKDKADQLKEIADDKFIPMSVLIREGIDYVLEKYGLDYKPYMRKLNE